MNLVVVFTYILSRGKVSRKSSFNNFTILPEDVVFDVIWPEFDPSSPITFAFAKQTKYQLCRPWYIHRYDAETSLIYPLSSQYEINTLPTEIRPPIITHSRRFMQNLLSAGS